MHNWEEGALGNGEAWPGAGEKKCFLNNSWCAIPRRSWTKHPLQCLRLMGHAEIIAAQPALAQHSLRFLPEAESKSLMLHVTGLNQQITFSRDFWKVILSKIRAWDLDADKTCTPGFPAPVCFCREEHPSWLKIHFYCVHLLTVLCSVILQT